MKRTISLLLSLIMVLALVPFSTFSVGAESYTDSQGVTYTLSDDGTFYIVSDCDESATSVVIPESYNGLPVKEIGSSAFFSCVSLTNIEIPNSVIHIGKSTFGACYSLTSIEVPDSVSSIDYWTFGDCYNLSSIKIPNSVTAIGERAFSSCESLSSVEIPNSVTSIGNNAFDFCTNLTTIEIPNSVTSVGINAFYYCESLTDIYCEAESQPDGWAVEGYYEWGEWHGSWNYGCDATVHWGAKMSGSVEEPETGDINGNGGIDSMDYLYLKRAFFKQYVLSNISVGDINKNGSIDSMDYLYLKRAFFKQYVIE